MPKIPFNEVRARAKALGVKQPRGANKPTLVRLIQLAEGNFDCFGKAENGECDQTDCLWREDCFKAAEDQS